MVIGECLAILLAYHRLAVNDLRDFTKVDFIFFLWLIKFSLTKGAFTPDENETLRANDLHQWFSNYHLRKYLAFQVPPLWPTLKCSINGCPLLRVCVCVCSLLCVCVCVCVCTLDGLNAEQKFWVCHVTFTFSSTIHSKKKKKNESLLILIRIFIIVSLLKYSKYTVWTWTLHRAYFHVNKKRHY